MPATATQQIAASASATGADAAGLAVERAMAGVAEPGLVIFFPTCDVMHAGARAADAAAGECPTVGMTVSATLAATGPELRGCAAMAFDSSVPTGVGVSLRASANPTAATFEATCAALTEIPEDLPHGVVLLFADTRSGDQADIISGAYRAAGPRIPLAGGGAGGEKPAQFANGHELVDSVVAVAIASERPIGVGVADGCRAVGVPSIVTRAEGRTLYELDGRPARAVYLEKLANGTPPRTDAEFERFAVLHPLAQPELGGNRRLRHVLGPGRDGGLYCATAVSPQAAVEFMVPDPELLVRSGRHAVERALEPLAGRPAAAALIFDCAGRKRALGGDLAVEVATIRTALGETPAIAGGYTHGEVGRTRGAKGDRNHALVAVAMG